MSRAVMQNLAGLAVFSIFLNFLIQAAPTLGLTFSCETNATGFKFDVEKLGGDWYEVTRFPSSEVPACVKVTAPKAITANNYTLELNYVDNVNGGWKHMKENLSFPWDDDTKKGFFNLYYGNDDATVNLTYKLVATDYDMALVCGYASLSSLSFLKIMARERQLNDTVKNGINELAQLYGIESQVTWVDQSDRCNGAVALWPTWTIFLAILYHILQRSKNLA